MIWCVGQETVTASRTPGMRRLFPPAPCRAPPPPRVDRARGLDPDLDNLDLDLDNLDLDNLDLALAPPTPPPLPHPPSPAGRDAPCPDPILQRGTGTATETPCRTCLRKIKICNMDFSTLGRHVSFFISHYVVTMSNKGVTKQWHLYYSCFMCFA